MSLGSILTAVITPFDERGGLDEDAFVRVLHHLHANGSDGVVACGTTGEAPTLSDAEHLRVVELAVSEVPDGMTVVAGTGSNDTAHAVHMTERATELGADAILSVTPYYNRPNPRGLVAHYNAVSRATDKPIVLYNIPSRTALDIPNDLLAELAQIEHIDYVKQANHDNLAPIDGLGIYAGNDDMLLDVLELGEPGGICVASHVVGAEMRRMVDEPASRASVHASLLPVFEALSVTTNPTPVKAACWLMGLCGPRLRLPMVECSEEELDVVRSALVSRGLLAAAPA